MIDHIFLNYTTQYEFIVVNGQTTTSGFHKVV